MSGSVAHEYFSSLRHGTTEPQERAYADDAVITIQGALENASKRELIAYFEELWAAFPDARFELLELVESGDKAAAHWRLRGTFAGPGPFNGMEPNGARVDIRGIDLVTIRDGRIVRNDAYTDGATIARQLGVLPPAGSPLEQRMTRAANLRTRAARHLQGGDPEPVADGVWRVQGGDPAKCNVYLIREDGGDGVLMFDAGARIMAPAVARAAARLGGLTRIVLGHGHTDHRGTAPSFDVPVLCHPDDVQDAEGSGGRRYWDPGLRFLPVWQRAVHKQLHRRVWDGGPVKISGTVSEGDEVAGFRVVHLPGHAPGLIALWREADRLALTSDAFYTLDMWGRDCEPQLPLDGYNLDTEQARASLRKLAALDPAAAWPGHARPVTSDVRARLERAAGG
jgi:steroid delta-isomerase-like uncharacterized protein